MLFRPTTAQLECIAVLANARASTDAIAAAVGLEAADFRQWLACMHAAKLMGEVKEAAEPRLADWVNSHVVRGIY